MPRRLTMALQALALAALCMAAATAETPLIDGVFRYGFSECVDNQRTLFYYADEALTCSADNESIVAKPPVKGLRCDIVCDKGFFLGANFSAGTPVSGCEKCPKGQYSLGGGKLYSRHTKAWTTPLPIDIHTECVTRNLYTNQWEAKCNPWRASSDGSMVESGENSDILTRFDAGRLFSSLRISATFVRNGTVTFQYRVSAEPPYDGLVFAVNDKTVMPLVSRTDGWREAVFEVGPGAHTFSWDYTKDFSGDEGDDKAFVKVIELVGTSFSDTYCHPCGGDVTMTGGSLCAFCRENEYAAPRSNSELDYVCKKCPAETFAPKGSIGLDSCVKRRPCGADDVVETFTPCVNGKRNATFAWAEPKTCEENLAGSSDLPEPKVDVACAACSTGFYLDESNKCVACPIGERLGNGGCEKCPAGKVVVKELQYGRGTSEGWSGWPSIVDVDAAKEAGWKLTRDGLIFEAPPSRRGNRIDQTTRFSVPFNVTFAHTGTFELMYVLKNVPTFENDGARAWLELEIENGDASVRDKIGDNVGSINKGDDDDDDETEEDVDGDGVSEQIVHFANGAMNGTFSEVIHINVTKPTLKQFQLVLRATTPQAARTVQAKLMLFRFKGTDDGPGVFCDTCPPGYQAIHSADFNGCQVCPAGTFSSVTDGVPVCMKCPPNTVSAAGSSKCEPCGSFTFNNGGEKSCAAPLVLTANQSLGETITYNLASLQSLVWGNATLGSEQQENAAVPDEDTDEDFATNNAVVSNTTTSSLGSEPVLPIMGFEIDASTRVFGGIFRPLSSRWKHLVRGQITKELVDSENDRPYIIELSVLNERDAGGYFTQTTGRYGDVQCSVPAQWKVTSGGNQLAISPFSNGTGVQVDYTGGTPCKNGVPASTRINFICDVKAGTTVPPAQAVRDSSKCHTDIEWRTALACPLCDASYFEEIKSSCNGGTQSISYTSTRPCHGGYSPKAVPVSTCSEVVLDSRAVYTVYAVISVVAFVVLLLLVAIMVIHRKYRNAYNEYMYLKGKMPINEVVTKDGSKESTFEFTPKSTAIHAGSPSLDDITLSPTLEHEDEEKTALEDVRSV
ncbi:hypothetical protein PINS_up007868 [Pythium insidiosum]|nr:hypothetical protein PINS_up007868 [Pythium insidiosum]